MGIEEKEIYKKRLAAFLIDSFIIIGVYAIISTFTKIIRPKYWWLLSIGGIKIELVISILLLLIIEYSIGRSPGKILASVFIVPEENAKKRCLIKLFPIIGYIFGSIFAFINIKISIFITGISLTILALFLTVNFFIFIAYPNKSLHDIIAKTSIIVE